MSVTTSLERIKCWATLHDPQFVALLQPGLSRQEIDAQVSGLPFALAEEVYEMYHWHNGQGWGDFKFGLQQSFLYPFLPLQIALKEYTEIQAENFQFELEWEDFKFAASGGWLPLLGMEAYYTATLGAAAGKHTSPLVSITRDAYADLVYPSLGAMLDYRADIYESDALRSDDERGHFFDYTLTSAVRRKHFSDNVAQAEESYRQELDLTDKHRSTRPDRPTETEIEQFDLVRALLQSGSEQAISATELFLTWMLGDAEEAHHITQSLVRSPYQITREWRHNQSFLLHGLPTSFDTQFGP